MIQRARKTKRATRRNKTLFAEMSLSKKILIAAGWLACALGSDAIEKPRPLFRDFMGINGHTLSFRPELYRPVASLVRDYHPVEWDLGKDSDYATPFPSARNGVNWNTVYGSWREARWTTDVSLMFETLKREQWKDLAADPRRYGERFARAFGPSGAHPLVQSAEIGNEPGKFSDADYRVVFENMARGLKTGDSKIRVVTGALTTGKSHDYAKSVECIKGLEAFYDVLNVHSYAQLENWPTWRRSFPEDPKLKEYLGDIRNLCAWRDANAPGKEVWLTEFGYDSSTKKPEGKGDFGKWVGVSDEQQAQWIVRSWLAFATLPIDRAYLYFFNDDDAPQLHGSSGLTRHFAPKPSFHASAHLHRVLGDYRFARLVVDRPGDARVYEFQHESGSGRRIWVAWSPTGNGRVAKLDPPPGETWEHVERMPTGAEENVLVPLEKGSRAIPIGESPVYIFLK
jgi:hypothetical protein